MNHEDVGRSWNDDAGTWTTLVRAAFPSTKRRSAGRASTRRRDAELGAYFLPVLARKPEDSS